MTGFENVLDNEYSFTVYVLKCDLRFNKECATESEIDQKLNKFMFAINSINGFVNFNNYDKPPYSLNYVENSIFTPSKHESKL